MQDPRNDALILIHAGYRIVLCLLLGTMFLSSMKSPIIGAKHPDLFLITLSLYGAAAILFGAAFYWLRPRLSEAQITAHFCVDVFALSILAYSSFSEDSGVTALLLASIAAANVLLPRRMGIFLAAIAAIGVLVATGTAVLVDGASRSRMLPAGVLGIAFFLTTFAIQTLAARIRSSQKLAEIREEDLAQLTRINERIVQRLKTGVIVLTPGGMVRLMNQAAAELLNMPQGVLAKLPIRAPGVLRELDLSMVDRPVMMRMPDGSRELQVVVSGLGKDVSGEKLLFIEDSSHLSQRAQELKLASLGRFSASIAHEIRNPLGAISNAAELLAEDNSLADDEQRMVEIIGSQSQRLNRVIENILELSRRDYTEQQTLELVAWLEEFREQYLAYHPGQVEVDLELEISACNVICDPSQLQQVVENIVNNGLYFSEQTTGKPRIHIRLHHHTGNATPIIDIIDYGPGLLPFDRERIFEPFYTTRSEGTGLGLYIARELCQSNRIALSCLEAETGGCCFRLQFSGSEQLELTV